MRRYWHDVQLKIAEQLTIDKDLFHHIFDVCRVEKNQHFELLNSSGQGFLVHVDTIEKKRATVTVIEIRKIPELKKPHIHLFISMPKFSTLEAVIEKSVELGVHSIHPFYSDYSFVKSMTEKDWLHKHERWQKIIISATQQSGRGELMRLEKPFAWKDFVKHFNQFEISKCLFFYEGDSALNAKQAISQFKEYGKTNPISSIGLVIGSEGGFSTNEINSLSDLGLSPVTLGSQVLRVETACLSGLSILKYEFDLMEA
ncbi:MAG: 16S rRNA (uracil(1498)-N(3))-methyltransferase [Bdellovibrionaceae bacterium]|nr:16S rRNA (uracil(1498)-N(3))-methyltransferase [Pseudobdellovibrionaceae bacterium]